MTALTDPPVGQVVDGWFTDATIAITALQNGGIRIVKGTNETINNNATLQADNELLSAVPANSKLIGRLGVQYSAHATAAFKMDFTLPTGASIPWATFLGKVAGPTIAMGPCSASGSVSGLIGAGVGVASTLEIWFTVTTGANAGTVTWRWAQNTAHLSDCVVYAGSYLKLEKTT